MYKRTVAIECRVNELHCISAFGFIFGAALDCLARAEREAKEKQKKLLLEQARFYLSSELERHPKLADYCVCEAPVDMDTRVNAALLILSYECRYWELLFHPEMAKDIRSFGQVTKNDIRQLINVINGELNA